MSARRPVERGGAPDRWRAAASPTWDVRRHLPRGTCGGISHVGRGMFHLGRAAACSTWDGAAASPTWDVRRHVPPGTCGGMFHVGRAAASPAWDATRASWPPRDDASRSRSRLRTVRHAQPHSKPRASRNPATLRAACPDLGQDGRNPSGLVRPTAHARTAGGVRRRTPGDRRRGWRACRGQRRARDGCQLSRSPRTEPALAFRIARTTKKPVIASARPPAAMIRQR